jgi:hypothetical protein
MPDDAGSHRIARPPAVMTPRTLFALIVCIACGAFPTASRAFDIDLVNAGVRWRVGGEDVIGKEQKEDFHSYDVWANARLPWQHYGESGWGVGTRLLTSAGVLKGGGTSALALSVLPLVALGSKDSRFTVDAGMGLALLSRAVYGQQDFGGYLQAALTFGIHVPIYQRLGGGYRFMHYSDAGIYGHDTIGADIHTLEFSYRF